MIKDLLFEQYKNFKILFRNLSSVLLLIIGPLFLIMLIGFAYSGEGIHDIRIGIISADYEFLEPAFQNFSTFGEVIKYDKTGECVYDMTLQKTHICLEFSEGFADVDDNELPSGTITFYFDNSRKSISNKIVSSISGYFGVEAEKISIESAKTIFSNIQSLVVYLELKNQDINSLIEESFNIKQSLVERRDRLVEIREEFLPSYEKIKSIQLRLNNLSVSINDSYSEYNESMAQLKESLEDFSDELERLSLPKEEFYFYYDGLGYKMTSDLSFLLDSNITFYNLSSYPFSINNSLLQIDEFNITQPENISLNTTNVSMPQLPEIDLSSLEATQREKIMRAALMSSIWKLEESLEEFSEDTGRYYSYTNEQKAEFDNIVLLLDNVKEMLDTDIATTEEYIVKIESAVVEVEKIQQELNTSLQGMSKLDPSLAEKLVKPILNNYEPLLKEIENINIAFPGMLAIIIIFISILFANIVTLAEINSKAFYRNMLAPVNSILFVAGLIITNIVVVFFQIIVLLLVGQFRFGIDIFSVLWPLLLVIFLLSLFFICLGMAIAILLKNEQTAILTATFSALGFFLFSDSVTPLESMPVLASVIAAKNPFVIASLAFKKLLIFGLPLELIAQEVIYLGFYVLVSMVLLLVVSKLKLKDKR